MSETKTIKNPSPLVQAVLAIDEHFTNMKRLSARIDEMDVHSDFDMKQSERLIQHFSESGVAVTQDINQFINVLNEARTEAETAAQKVAAKADQLRLRKDAIQEKLAQFDNLVRKVTDINQVLLQFKSQGDEGTSDQRRESLKGQLADISSQLNGLISEAEEFQKVGHEYNIKVLQQNADSLKQTLTSVRTKINGMLTLQ